MIRRAIVPLIALCAALGVGIALGGGPLSDRGDASTAASASTRRDQAVTDAQVKEGQKLAAATAPLLYAKKLTGRQVAIVVMPGAPSSVVTTLAGQIGAAGGVVTSTTQIARTAIDPSSKPLVDTLGSQLAPQVHGLVDATQAPYTRLGQLIGGSVGTTAASAAPTADQSTALATLAESKLVTVAGAPATSAGKAAVRSTAPLVLVVLGDHVDPTILAGIVQGTATRAHGVVVAGSTGSGLRGDLKRLRATSLGAQARTVATVDGDEQAVGQVATVLALVHQVAGGGGAYGASGIDGVAPLS